MATKSCQNHNEMPNSDPEIDTDVDGPSAAQSITRDVIKRKKAQDVKSGKKIQPWKQTHRIAPEDLPSGRSMLHENPWFNPDEYPEQDSSYAA